MNAMATTLWLSCVLALPAPGDDAPAREADDLLGRVQALVQPMLEKKKSVGMVFGVIEGGRTHVFGFGREAVGGDKPPDGKTIFEIGSVTKVFTSLALAQMVEEGLVRLDDPVGRYLLDADEGRPSAAGTARSLLSEICWSSAHPSGLHPAVPGTSRSVPARRALAGPAVPSAQADLQPSSAIPETRMAIPGPKFEYSNLGCGLLGHALARGGPTTAGSSRPGSAERLGMSDAEVTLNDEQERASLARPYTAGASPLAAGLSMSWLPPGASIRRSMISSSSLSAELGIKELEASAPRWKPLRSRTRGARSGRGYRSARLDRG